MYVLCYILFRAWLCDALNYSAKALEKFFLKIFNPPEAVWFVVLSYISETAILAFDV